MYTIQEDLTMQRQLIRLFYEKNCKKMSLCFGPNWELHSIQRCDLHSNANVQGLHSIIG